MVWGGGTPKPKYLLVGGGVHHQGGGHSIPSELIYNISSIEKGHHQAKELYEGC